MRAYLAILRDSFHEALASRVLWILLILTTLFLLVLAPLGSREQAGSLLTSSDFTDMSGFVNKLKEQSAASEPSPGKRVWPLLSDDLRRRLSAPATGPGARFAEFGAQGDLVEELNELLTRRDLYNEESWSGIELGVEAKDLLEQRSSLPADRLARLNRILLQSAYQGEIVIARDTQTMISYLTIDAFGPFPVSIEDFRTVISLGLLVFMKVVLGVGGMLVALFVTASVIPHTFEAGAIDLLLSKPITRAGVYLGKFVGGCSFVVLTAGYLLLGLWLILGWRWEIWNEKLLLCVPIYVFVFAIYYSVAGLAGLIWRNAIVSVMIAVLLWGACFSFGFAHGWMDVYLANTERIVRIESVGSSVLGVTQGSHVVQWDQARRDWKDVFAGPPVPRLISWTGVTQPLIGPIYDSERDRIYGADAGGMSALFGGGTLSIGKPDDSFKRTQGINVPPGTVRLLATGQREILAVTANGLFRLQGNPEQKPQAAEVFGFKIPLTNVGGKFVEVGPRLPLNPTLVAAVQHVSGDVTIYDRKRLLILGRTPQAEYELRKEIEFKEGPAASVAFPNGAVLFATADGRIDVYDPDTLTIEATLEIDDQSVVPTASAASRDGRWAALVLGDERLWLYDASTQKPADVRVTGQGDISATAFTPEGRLLVADRSNRVTEYDPATWRIEKTLSGRRGLFEILFQYFLKPIYTVFPKPADLDALIMSLVFEQDTIPVPAGDPSSQAPPVELDIWGPIWSNLGFIAVMLAIGCIYVARKDF